jgi:hypothetical protein
VPDGELLHNQCYNGPEHTRDSQRWKMTDTPRHKPPSRLSMEIFTSLVAADGQLPQSLREAVAENQDRETTELLIAIKRAIGKASET